MQNIAILGAKGMLGREISRVFNTDQYNIIQADLPDYDVTAHESIEKIFKSKPIHIVINCSSYTDVAKAEQEKDKALFVNCHGTNIISKLCKKYNSLLIHFSTDFVFNGDIDRAYREEDITNPLNWYGYTKLKSEKIVQSECSRYIIFRLQWLYSHVVGEDSKSFIYKIVQKLKEGKPFSVVEDEKGSPCSVQFVSSIIKKIIEYPDFEKIFSGRILHLTHDNSCSRYECAEFIKKYGYFETPINPTKNIESSIKRPKFGVLDNGKLMDVISSLDYWEKDLLNYIRGNL